jgi:hypothetical protein
MADRKSLTAEERPAAISAGKVKISFFNRRVRLSIGPTHLKFAFDAQQRRKGIFGPP